MVTPFLARRMLLRGLDARDLLYAASLQFGPQRRRHGDERGRRSVRARVLFAFLLYVVFNPFVDYVSAVETRLILRTMARHSRVRILLALGSLDLLATTVIVLTVFPFGTVGLWWFLNLMDGSPLYWGLTYPQALGPWVGDAFSGSLLGVYVYTTFATTIWTWLYLAADTLFRTLPAVRRFAPVERTPFRSLGLAVAVLGALLWFAIGVFHRTFVAIGATL